MKNNKLLNSLINNTFVIGVGSALSKILLFILVPILTRVLSPEMYGLSELLTNSVNLALPIFSIVIFEAIMRYSLDASVAKMETLAIGIKVSIYGFAILIPIVLLSYFVYPNIIILAAFLSLYILSALKNCFVYYARSECKFLIITIISVAECVLLLLSVVFLVCIENFGLNGYIISMIISSLLADVLYIIFLKVNFVKLFNIKNKNLEREMIKYSIPMIFNSLGWWINNVSDRYMLSYFCSITVTGIYSISYKIPGLLNTLVDIFMQAWKVSATEEFESGRIKHYGYTYIAFLNISFLICSLLILFSHSFSQVLFGTEYQDAWRYSIILIIAFFFNGISNYLGSIFTAAKNTKYIGTSTIVGAVVNIVFNLILISMYDALGAAIATVISNAVIYCMRGSAVRKIIDIKIINYKMIITFMMLLFEMVLSFYNKMGLSAFIFIVILINSIVELYRLRGKWEYE